MPSNRTIIQRAETIQTGSLNNGGLLNPYQARKFIQQTFEVTNLAPLVRHEMRAERRGEIDKIGIASRIVREKTENTDDGYRAGVTTSQLKFSTTPIRLTWEVTEETLRQNIEGEDLDRIITDLMTAQLGVDLEDLYLNGDEETPAKIADPNDSAGAAQIDNPDYAFLKINDGWIKQIKNGGHVYDATAETEMSLDIFYKALASLPNKYNNGKLRWLMSPRRAQQWELFLMNKIIGAGGAVPDNVYTAPAKIPVVECPSMSDDKILLTDPKNLVVVNSYTMKVRSTNTDKESIMMDKRFYVIHLDYDPIIEETDATGIILLK